jgi:DMSO/TMAO reductase YedYZ molybdopterin-dependent catalytic subunit
MYKPEILMSEKRIRNKTFVALIIFVLFIIGCVLAWRWLHHQPTENGALKPLRTILNVNEKIAMGFFNNDRFTKTFSKGKAVQKVRVNGSAGLENNADTANWKLHLVRAPGDTLLIGMEEIKALPKTDIVFDFKCIEGWSQVTHWAGVRFSDFVKKYGLTKASTMHYAGLVTPDHKYYVGIDMKSMMHPQTILCYEMNGAPLPLNQGYPLRLIIPVKYGVKHLKRIGTLSFSDERPKDYWYENGYDYYCGF